QPRLELPKNRSFRVPAHANDERKPELVGVGLVESVKPREFFRGQASKSRTVLLRFRIRRHGSGLRRFAGKLRMLPQESEFLGIVDRAHGFGHAFVQRNQGGKRPPFDYGFRHPGRVLENAAERGNEFRRRHAVKLIKRNFAHVDRQPPQDPLSHWERVRVRGYSLSGFVTPSPQPSPRWGEVSVPGREILAV